MTFPCCATESACHSFHPQLCIMERNNISRPDKAVWPEARARRVTTATPLRWVPISPRAAPWTGSCVGLHQSSRRPFAVTMTQNKRPGGAGMASTGPSRTSGDFLDGQALSSPISDRMRATSDGGIGSPGSDDGVATINQQIGTGDHVGAIRSQKHGGGGNLLGQGKTASGDACLERFALGIVPSLLA